MPAAKTPGCKVCHGPEPRIVDKLLLLGRSPRRIGPPFGHSRRDVRRHAETCLRGERRAAVERELLEMAGVGGVGR